MYLFSRPTGPADGETFVYLYTYAVNIDDGSSDQEYKKEIDRMQGGMRDSYDRQIRTLDRTLDVSMYIITVACLG